MSRKEEILSILKAHKEALKAGYGVEKMGLFGSLSRGEESEESDVDILFEIGPEAKMSLFSYLKLTAFLEERLHRKVDLVRESALKNELKPYVFKDLVYV